MQHILVNWDYKTNQKVTLVGWVQISFEAFCEIKEILEEQLTNSHLANEEICSLYDKLNSSYVKGVTEAHLAANLLHPKTMGKNMANALINCAIHFIDTYSAKLEMNDQEDIRNDWTSFKPKSGLFNSKFL